MGHVFQGTRFGMVEISPLDHRGRGSAQDRDRQDPALQAAGGRHDRLGGGIGPPDGRGQIAGMGLLGAGAFGRAGGMGRGTGQRSCCCTKAWAASRCGAIVPQRLAQATGLPVLAYSRAGYGGSDPRRPAAPAGLHDPRGGAWCCRRFWMRWCGQGGADGPFRRRTRSGRRTMRAGWPIRGSAPLVLMAPQFLYRSDGPGRDRGGEAEPMTAAICAIAWRPSRRSGQLPFAAGTTPGWRRGFRAWHVGVGGRLLARARAGDPRARTTNTAPRRRLAEAESRLLRAGRGADAASNCRHAPHLDQPECGAGGGGRFHRPVAT